MAYNLQSLITILEHILNPQQTHYYLAQKKPQLQSLLETAASLQQILEKSSLPKIESLESHIRDLAHRAEDIIESNMVDRMLSVRQGMSFILLRPDVQQVTQELDCVMDQVVKLVERKKIMEIGSSSLTTEDSVSSSNKGLVVGVDADLLQLKDRLTGMESKLGIIPIVGMGGIGKTTLARKLYDDPLILSHFDTLAWTTISQDHNMQAILISLLRCIIGKDIETGNDELKDILYKSLYGRRYMIVLDDIWSTKFWDDIRRYFPDNNNGSRIVITTRESDVAKYADSNCVQHEVQLLSKSESWNLLGQILFEENDDCPHELQGIGRKIASDCGGLPLAINVIEGLLSKVERSRDVWENIGNDVRAALAESEEHEHYSNVLSLSYNHLPNHLKPCFLYVGAFPEDYEIKGSEVIRMWVAEGFIKSSNGDKSLEEEAEDYLKALVDRNLVLVRRYKSNGKAMSYSMHDLLRDLCIKKADEERFLHVVKKAPEVMTFSNPRRVSVHMSSGIMDEDVDASLEFMSLARSFICICQSWYEIPFPEFLVLRLLRVLDIMNMFVEDFPVEIFQLVNLRYLAFKIDYSSLPAGISRLWNLQTLIAMVDVIDEPSEIWQLPDLRHLHVSFKAFEYAKWEDIVVQKKLQVVSTIWLNPSLIESGLFKKIPNIKELSLYDDGTGTFIAVDLGHLQKLEVLAYTCYQYCSDSLYLSGFKFPPSLRKLSLDNSRIPTRVLTTISALPNLEVLKIVECKFETDEWDMTAEGDEFRSLQFLHLESSGLVHWQADETSFLRLRHLCIRRCWRLREIPSGFGEITMLQSIELQDCN